MKCFLKSSVIISTGLAMFSMFFGAGNIVFPLALGRIAGDKNIFAIIGFLITAVGVPFLGLLGMILFDGNYKNFFFRIGRVPGFLLICLIVSMIGPFAAMPRCVDLSYAAIKTSLPNLSLFTFSLISVVLIFLFSIKESKILDILGYFLSPILLISLLIIIVKGIMTTTSLSSSSFSNYGIFLQGLTNGYDTMDLLATFFFSSMVLIILRNNLEAKVRSDYKQIALIALKASLIGATLLGLVYLGLSFVSSFWAPFLHGIDRDLLLSHLAFGILGSTFGIVASVAVSLACLTTAIALAAIFSDFLRYEICGGRLGYAPSLVITLIITAIFSNLGFEGIMKIIHPMVLICYPAIIVLAVSNIAYKLFNFKVVKIPVFVTFVVSLVGYCLSYF